MKKPRVSPEDEIRVISFYSDSIDQSLKDALAKIDPAYADNILDEDLYSYDFDLELSEIVFENSDGVLTNKLDENEHAVEAIKCEMNMRSASYFRIVL